MTWARLQTGIKQVTPAINNVGLVSGGGWNKPNHNLSLNVVASIVVGAIPSSITVTDAAGNTYTRIGVLKTATGIGIALHYSDGAAPAATITSTVVSASAALTVVAMEFQGYSSVTVDASTNGTWTSTTSPSAGPLAGLAGGANELVVCSIGQTGVSETTWSSFTSPAAGQGSTTLTNAGGGGIGYHINPSAGSNSIAGLLGSAVAGIWVMAGLLGTGVVQPDFPTGSEVRTQAVNRAANFFRRASGLLAPPERERIVIPQLVMAR